MPRSQIAISTEMSIMAGANLISVWDVTTVNMLSTFKSTSSNQQHTNINLTIPRHCIDRIGYLYLINAYQNSPILNVWSLDRKDRLHKKMIAPWVVSCLAVSSDSCYCLAGIATKLYLWQISSGYLLNVLDKHYQPIRIIRIADDMSYFITGGEDGIIMIWNMTKVLVASSESFSVIDGRSSQNEPDCIINDSSMALIDIHLGNGGRKARFVTCSEQSNLVKIYQLYKGILLATISFPKSIVSVLMNRIESSLFCGSICGDVYELSISHIGSNDAMQKSNKNGSQSAHFDFSMQNENENEDQKKPKSDGVQIFSGHQGAICSMAITIDGQGLLTGSNDKTIRIWHIDSHQCVKKIQCKGPVSNLMVYPSMSGLFLHDSLLESSDYSLSNIDSNQIDISLKQTTSSSSYTARSSGNKRSSKNDKSSFETVFSRPQSVEQTLRTIPNPPAPIQQFQRDVFRLRFNPIDLIQTKLRGDASQIHEVEPTESGLFNAFDHGGCLWVRNDQTSGQELWPWKNFMIPDGEQDLPRIFPQQQIDQELMRSKWKLMEKCINQKKQQQTQRTGKNLNNDNNKNNNKRQKTFKQTENDSLPKQAVSNQEIPMADISSNGCDDVVILGGDGHPNQNQNDLETLYGIGNKNVDDCKQDDRHLEQKICQLNKINYDLYRYALEKIFETK